MKREAIFILMIFTSLVFYGLSCDKIPGQPENDQDTFYYQTSFENASDIAGWEGLTVDDLVEDSPSGGGDKSALIGGGCVLPTVSITFPPTGKNMPMRIEFYGKAINIGGSVSMHIGGNFHEALSMLVSDTGWTYISSDTIIWWPADSSLSVWLNSGGFGGASMLIDEFKVIQLEEADI